MSKFKVGNRVMVYYVFPELPIYPAKAAQCTGEISDIPSENLVFVKLDNGVKHLFHSKQCRKLKVVKMDTPQLRLEKKYSSRYIKPEEPDYE